MLSRRMEVVIAATAIAVAWIACGAAWWASLVTAGAYARLGADLPSSTALVIEASRNGVPFVLAALLTLAIVVLLVRRNPHLAPASAAVASVGALALAVAELD